ncbi:MAG: hypothetical protein B6247_13450 [Candidatus Parabeggiatoa sp. nov. 2]|nr:MAG: hypothetical protein B6247_13450 [Beggiatoa sp. 4572_84]
MNLENAEPMVADESEKLAKQRPEEIARRYDNRAGYDLVSWRKVGLPVYKITVHALIQLHKSIPPIEEFVLKTIKAGLSSEQEIGGLLGLEFVLVREAIINLRTSEDIDLIAPDPSSKQVWKLTLKGERTLRNLKIVVPQARTFTIHFDGLLWHPHWYGQHLESSLLKPRELKQGMIEISPCQTQKPELSDLSLIEVDRIIEKIESESRRKVKREQDLLALKAIDRRERLYQPALILIYKAKEGGGDPQVAFVIDGILSEKHETAFAHSNGVKKHRIFESLRVSDSRHLVERELGTDVKQSLDKSETLKTEVTSVQTQIENVQKNIEQVQTDEEKVALEQKIVGLQRKIAELKKQQSSVPIRWLEVYEHRPLLEKVLNDSKERLLIISPWIRASATNSNLIRQIEKLLKANVKVFIGYGLGEEDEKNAKTEEKIQRLAHRYSNFYLKRLGDTHAKILISDKKLAVVTSFNWLSFKGDPNREFRDERGTLISEPQKIDELFDSYMKRFNEQV